VQTNTPRIFSHIHLPVPPLSRDIQVVESRRVVLGSAAESMARVVVLSFVDAFLILYTSNVTLRIVMRGEVTTDPQPTPC